MQQVGVIALLGRWYAPAETLVGVIVNGDAGTPGLVRERRVGDHIVIGTQLLAILELGVGEGVALYDIGGWEVVQDHVHARQTGGADILFLPFKGNVLARLGSHLQQQRAGAASRVIGHGAGGGVVRPYAQHLRQNTAHFGGGIELPLALAALAGEVTHQVFVGIAQNVIMLCTVLGEVEFRLLKYGDQIGQAIHHRLAFTQLVGIVEIREVAA